MILVMSVGLDRILSQDLGRTTVSVQYEIEKKKKMLCKRFYFLLSFLSFFP